MTARYVISVEKLSPGIVDHFCPDDAPDIVQDISTELGSILLDHNDVNRLELAVEVN